jgi:hypothetical protein
MSFEYAIAREESMAHPNQTLTLDELFANRPGGMITNPRYSSAQLSRRTSSYSAYGMQSNPPQQQQLPPQQRQERVEREHHSYSREQEYPTPPRDKEYAAPPREREYPIPVPAEREGAIFKGGAESNGESSGASSYDPSYSQIHYPQQPTQEYSPPSTPTRSKQFPQHQQPPPPTTPNFHFPQSSAQYGIPSPEPDVDVYPPVPPKPSMHTFVTRPATPPSEKKRRSKISRLKRFSVLGKSKSWYARVSGLRWACLRKLGIAGDFVLEFIIFGNKKFEYIFWKWETYILWFGIDTVYFESQ